MFLKKEIMGDSLILIDLSSKKGPLQLNKWIENDKNWQILQTKFNLLRVRIHKQQQKTSI